MVEVAEVTLHPFLAVMKYNLKLETKETYLSISKVPLSGTFVTATGTAIYSVPIILLTQAVGLTRI